MDAKSKARRRQYVALTGRAAERRRRRKIIVSSMLALIIGGMIGLLHAWYVNRNAQDARTIRAHVSIGAHDGVCDAEDSSPEWFDDADCTDPYTPASTVAVCVDSAGVTHDCVINLTMIHLCASWDGSGSAHPCLWDTYRRGVGGCPRAAGVTVKECTGRFVFTGRTDG